MKKRIISFLLLGTMAISLLAGCGSDKETSNDDVLNTQTIENSVTNEAMVDTEIETESVTEEIESIEVVEETTETQQGQSEETEQPSITYTYTDMSATMYAKQSVNVRSLPSTDGEKLGALSYAQEVNVTAKCNETSWYRIDFNGSVGYVSNNYLLTEKPAEQPVAPSEPTEPSQPDSRYGGYWDYVDNSNLTYTGASLYTNTTYGTSFTVPTTAEVGTNLFCQQSCGFDKNGNHVLAIASMRDTNIGITLLMYDSSYASSGSELWNKESMYDPYNYNLTAEYDTTIGGNSYHCYEYSLHNGTPCMWLTRNTNGKLIHYKIGNCSSLDTVKQYILY